MKALIFDKHLQLADIAIPRPAPDEVLIKVVKAGICNTDIEITRGYMDFKGVLGHEFIGLIQSQDNSLNGRRVTAEINCSCGNCELCKNGRDRHCPSRSVIGISGRNGAFAEYIVVPFKNVFFVPDDIPDNNAVFIEPLAAALEILDQILIKETDSVLVIGDGKLAQLVSIVLNTTGCKIIICGRHENKLSYLENRGMRTCFQSELSDQKFDIVIEASGSSEAFLSGLSKVKPKGTFVLKSTYASSFTFNPALVVINEITIIGSR